MTKVYLVMIWNYEDSSPDSIWTSREAAEKRASIVRYAQVEEYELDEDPGNED